MAFFRLPGHYVFDYKPLYYDPEKEKRQKRIQRIKKELGIETEIEENYKPDISFRRTSITRKRRERSALTRFIIILAFLALMFYILLFTSYFDRFVDLIK